MTTSSGEIDPRLQWFVVRISSSFPDQPKEKVLQVCTDYVLKRPLARFLDERECNRVYVYYLVKDKMFKSDTEYPTDLQSNHAKVLAFIKTDHPLSANIGDKVMSLECIGFMPEYLQRLTTQVYSPMIDSPALSELGSTRDVLYKLHTVMSQLHVLVGRTKGKTLLPLLPDHLTSDNLHDPKPKTNGKQLARSVKAQPTMAAVESIVITWMSQIKEVTCRDSEAGDNSCDVAMPENDLAFWKQQSTDLNDLYDQLIANNQAERALSELRTHRSMYTVAFHQLCRDLAAKCEEANDIYIHLKPLGALFDHMSSEKLVDLPRSLIRTLHHLYLIWGHSNYLRYPTRIVILVRKIINRMIAQARAFVSNQQLFTQIPEEGVERLDHCLHIFQSFRELFLQYQKRIAEEYPTNPWELHPILFHRFDSFVTRCAEMKEIMENIVELNFLDKIEVGGTRGTTLAAVINQANLDFNLSLTEIREAPFELSDIESKGFQPMKQKFKNLVEEIERKLATVAFEMMEESSTIMRRFHVLDGFHMLLRRDLVQPDLEYQKNLLLVKFNRELVDIANSFQEGQQAPSIPANMPPRAGAVAWARSLVNRMKLPLQRMQATKNMPESEEGQEILALSKTITEQTQAFESQQLELFNEEAAAISEEKLQQTLLTRDNDNPSLVKVNFDAALLRVLREVKYFLLLGVEVSPVPLDMYKKAEVFRQYTNNLETTVKIFNDMCLTMKDIERPLLAQKLETIDKILKKGLESMNWNSQMIPDFLSQASVLIREVSSIHHTMKSNVQSINHTLKSWILVPILALSKHTMTVHSFIEHEHAHVTQRHEAISAGAESIHNCIATIGKVLKVTGDNPVMAATLSNEWRNYIDYLGDIVVEGIVNAAVANIDILCKHMTVHHNHNSNNSNGNGNGNGDHHHHKPAAHAFLSISLELQGMDLVFVPDISTDVHGSAFEAILQVCRGALNIGMLVPRIRFENQMGDYLHDVIEDVEIRAVMTRLMTAMSDAAGLCDEFRKQYEEHSFLWKKNLKEEFQQFLKKNTVNGEVALNVFDAAITQCHQYEEAAHKLSEIHIVSGWLQIDASPARHAIIMEASKWTYQYKEYLARKVHNAVVEFSSFIKEATSVMEKDIATDDVSGLINVLQCIRQVKIRTDGVLMMSAPMLEIIALLKKHGQSTEPAIITVLNDLPTNWADLQKKVAGSKEKYGAFTTEERSKLLVESKKIEVKVKDFVEAFRKKMPSVYSNNVDEAYVTIDKFHHGYVVPGVAGGLEEVMEDVNRINELQDLFEVSSSDFSELRKCQVDCKRFKALWDMIALVQDSYTDWRQTKWKNINVDALVERNAAMLKLVRLLDHEVRGWNAYSGLESAVKNMGTSLPLVQELHDPAMRERHWNQLSDVTKTDVTVDEQFTLGDMLSLELHKHADDVMEIVDRAQKELVIERQLAKIKSVWDTQQLEFYLHNDIYLLSPPEACVEILEENFVTLQSLQSSKYVQDNAVFAAEVAVWQENLATVDSILTDWMEVQKKWTKLHSIFVGSADIRTQLPDDAKRFQQADDSFKELMGEASCETNALACCNHAERLEKVEAILAQLELCEKALVDYLETKRVVYPRFYFVSGADLLDILSKGSNPQAISGHISKCFDNVKSLKFKTNDEGKETKYAVGMFSGEGEYVHFEESFHCEGAVEVWLKGLTAYTHDVLRHILTAATANYGECLRHEFMVKWPAQVAVVVLRVAFTEGVNESFDLIESGASPDALSKYNQLQATQLNTLAQLVLTELTKNERRVLITVMTVDVHSRDVVSQLIAEKAESRNCFSWTSQLRYFMVDCTNKSYKCDIRIVDYSTEYGYEYIGNCGCLVITPLTDRCYITLTQAMKLCLGGAPAGPAGTGKTETTKDLGRSLGVLVYVFNCSDQMDYKSMGQIFKGLAQAGAWGCFDEFNRIDISVLSVVSTQFRSVLDAIKGGQTNFSFEEEEISLCRQPLCCAFITMNPGYAGRTELPESVKALFRPCAMIVPDMDLISEIMLMSEGFSEGKLLAKKFMILYRLNESLLSPQKHYDWKLRAIKTTLNVAGGMRRADPEMSEDKVLLRALRDFNLGKLVADDVGIFMGLLNDLFPKTLELVPRKRDANFEELIKKAARELNIQPEDIFSLKVSQLRELLEVRWSVFVLGPAGCGKSCIIKTLAKAQNMMNEKTTMHVLNPKAVTRNELYGYIHPATREWKDGLISQIFRDLANITNVPHEYIVLDGDIDPEWIESMNTVMDDNKMLTLASNERIPLTPPMRLLFEIENLREASPATVSRAGIIYMNDTDVGWQPVVTSWIEGLQLRDANMKASLEKLFHEHVTKTLEFVTKNLKLVVPLPKSAVVASVCHILESLLEQAGAHTNVMQVITTPVPIATSSSSGGGGGGGASMFGASAAAAAANNNNTERKDTILDQLFAFSCIWGIAGCVGGDKVLDCSRVFDKWWKDNIPIPVCGETVFSYRIDPHSGEPVTWDSEVVPYAHDISMTFASIFVSTAETKCFLYLHHLLVERQKKLMFVGSAGAGKTAIMREGLQALSAEHHIWQAISLNCKTTSLSLQLTMEGALEKKTGRTFGPPGKRKLTFFIDDVNMPQVDLYGTQQPIALLRQLCDHYSWYDRTKLTLKEIRGVSIVSCMNPLAGSFTIDPRMQRHFVTISCQMPKPDVQYKIFSVIIEGHLNSYTFTPEVKALLPSILKAAFEAHKAITENFLPTAVRFHYNFNLRELSALFEGLCRARPQFIKTPAIFGRLWLHECERVYCDRLMSEDDVNKFHEVVADVAKNCLASLLTEIMEKPLLFSSIAATEAQIQQFQVDGDALPPYETSTNMTQIRRKLEEKLEERNESNAVMNLVLFEQAVEHVCRITRVIEKPGGNSLLVGVGGSGKQSLAKLSAFICGYEVFQITVTSTYNVNDFKADLMALYNKAGLKSIGTCFIMTDGQIVDERFLVFMNDMLASGNIPDLYTNEEKDDVCNGVRAEMKQLSLVDTKENCWDYFIEKTRKYLHTVLCFSPVGDKFRVRARQFPALTACTCIDWFHSWPQEALVAVGQRFVKDVPNITPEMMEQLSNHMAHVHMGVNERSIEYLETERRYNYTTPKSFLDLIDLYKDLLGKKRDGINQLKTRLENGLEKLRSAGDQVAELQINLKSEMLVVAEKQEATEHLLVQVGQETAVAEEQKAVAQVEEEKCAVIAAEANGIAMECKQDLAAAEPLVAEAEAALNSLDKKSFTEMKSMANPPQEVADVMSAVMALTAPKGVIPKDLSWNAAKKVMASVDKFLKDLQTYDKDNVPENCCAFVEKNYLCKAFFSVENMKSKSMAAAGLCAWVVNICKYFRIYQLVEPKRQKLAEASARLDEANKSLTIVRSKVAELEARLAKLTAQFELATDEKNKALQQMERTQSRASLAERLVAALADEKIRWAASLEQFGLQERNLVGDVVVASAFVSYIGAFNARLRTAMINEKWIPDVLERQIPMTENYAVLDVLTDDAQIASWNNEGLPSDTVSVQNGAIITNCKRWPLMIDPQLQGIKWITKREEKKNMRLCQQTTHRYLDLVELAISNGEPIMIENCGESLDAVLEPVLSRSVIRRGRSQLIKLGDKEVEYDDHFQLYLQTKLSNPHYKPEVAAQTTLINFMITQEGLEEQLLALVVNKERPDLEEKKQELLMKQNEFKIQLKQLEDDLLMRLSSSEGDILANVELIENLEITKKTSKEIQRQVAEAKETEKGIQNAREVYRPVGIRGALLYFLMDSLWILDHMYRFSMANFVTILKKGMDKTDEVDENDENALALIQEIKSNPAKRVEVLIDISCFTVFSYVTQGLFERHKLIYATQLCMRILARAGQMDNELFDFLIRGPKATGTDNPLAEWLPDSAWASVQALHEFEGFENLPADIEASAKRFREWYELDRPEEHPLPGDLKKLSPFHRLCVLRCLRPDRVSDALGAFIKKSLGDKYMRSQPFDLIKSYEDARNTVPMFFILSPGVDPVKDVEAYGRKLGFTYESGKFALVSLGQGQEPVAEKALEHAHRVGSWTFLMNIHLTPRWTGGYLEKKLDKIADGAHEDFRLFLSAEPSQAMPVNILQVCIKLTNEPPEGLMENHRKSWLPFTDEYFENCTKPAEAKAIVFALSFFHAIIIERKKFGPQGWNRAYPFNIGDLTSCAQVTLNYLDNNPKIPWDDLVYIFGEIMYGGHITDDWDRKLDLAYLRTYMNEELIEGTELFPGFPTPSTSMGCKQIGEYIESAMPPETPVAFGLHPNAEIGFRLLQADAIFKCIVDLQPRSAVGGGGMSLQEKAKFVLDDIMDKMPEIFDMIEILEKVEERTPFNNVFLQECERMNFLVKEMRRSLAELDLGLKGDLQISDPMEQLMKALSGDKVPGSWEKLAWPSMRGLSSWLMNLIERHKQLADWTAELGLPKVTWISGLFSPQAFLTAVMQTTARKNDWPLDKTTIQTDVTKKNPEEITAASREGAFVTGLVLEGARWDDKGGCLDDSKPKELFAPMPVVLIKAITADKFEARDSYPCPVYKTQMRGPTWVFTAYLRTKAVVSKWVLAGVAVLMDVV